MLISVKKHTVKRCKKHYMESLNLEPIDLPDYDVTKKGILFKVKEPDIILEHKEYIYDIDGRSINGPEEYVLNRYFNNNPIRFADIVFKYHAMRGFKSGNPKELEETDYYIRPNNLKEFLLIKNRTDNTLDICDIGNNFRMRCNLIGRTLYCNGGSEKLEGEYDNRDINYVVTLRCHDTSLSLKVKLSEIRDALRIGLVRIIQEKIIDG